MGHVVLNVHDIMEQAGEREHEQCALLLTRLRYALALPASFQVVLDLSQAEIISGRLLVFGIFTILLDYPLEDLQERLSLRGCDEDLVTTFWRLGRAFVDSLQADSFHALRRGGLIHYGRLPKGRLMAEELPAALQRPEVEETDEVPESHLYEMWEQALRYGQAYRRLAGV